jgi:hypothetical protein
MHCLSTCGWSRITRDGFELLTTPSRTDLPMPCLLYFPSVSQLVNCQLYQQDNHVNLTSSAETAYFDGLHLRSDNLSLHLVPFPIQSQFMQEDLYTTIRGLENCMAMCKIVWITLTGRVYATQSMWTETADGRGQCNTWRHCIESGELCWYFHSTAIYIVMRKHRMAGGELKADINRKLFQTRQIREPWRHYVKCSFKQKQWRVSDNYSQYIVYLSILWCEKRRYWPHQYASL